MKKDTAVVAGDVIAKTKATVEQNLNKASEVATLAARYSERAGLRTAASLAAALCSLAVAALPCG